MSQPNNGGQTTQLETQGGLELTKKHQANQDDDGSSGSSSGSQQRSESSQGSQSDGDENDDNGQDDTNNHEQEWKQQDQGSNKFENKGKPNQSQSQDKPQRGNNGFNEQSFQNFNPKFTAGEDEQQEAEQTRDQYRNPGRGGFDRGGRGGGRGRGSFDRGGGFDRGDRNDRGDRGGRGSRGRGGDRGFGDRGFGDRNGSDRGFGDRGGRGGRGGGRGGRGGSFGDRDNFRSRDGNNGFGNRDNNNNSGFGNRGYGEREGQNNNQSFQNQLTQLRGSKSSATMQQENTQFQVPQQFPPAITQGQVPPGMFPVNYFPYIASDPQAAFKKKPGFSQQQKLSSSKVSKVSKVPSKLSKKDKKKKRKHSSDSSSSSSSQSSSDSEADRSLNMSLCQAAMDNDDSIIHALDQLKKKQKEKRNDKKRYEKLSPQGRKDWPGARLYVLGNVLQITFRNIQEHSDCVLVIPYEDTSMSLYPGTIVNKGQIDYRQKLEQKTETLKPGSVYTQDNLLSKEFLYHCIAFVKIDKQPETIENALKYIFQTLEKLQRKFKHLKNIVIPLSIFTYHQDKYPQFIKKVSSLMESKKFKSVSLTTRNKEEYEMAMKAFTDLTCEMIKKNEIGA